MDKKNYVKYIEPFLNYHKNAAKYISNIEIERYIEFNKFDENIDGIMALKEFYKEINVSRKVFSKFYYQETILPPKHEEFINSLKLKRYSRRTIKSYSSSIVQANKWFLSNYNFPLDKINDEAAINYFLYLTEIKNGSYSLVRMHRFSIEYYYIYILRKPINLSFMDKMKKDKHLPSILSKDEIQKIIKNIDNLKHRMIIALLYSAGLRVSEVINLKVEDISHDNLTLRVSQGKGKKDRVTIFSDKLSDDLKETIEEKNSNDYIFTSEFSPDNKLSTRTVQIVFKKR